MKESMNEGKKERKNEGKKEIKKRRVHNVFGT